MENFWNKFTTVGNPTEAGEYFVTDGKLPGVFKFDGNTWVIDGIPGYPPFPVTIGKEVNLTHWAKIPQIAEYE